MTREEHLAWCKQRALAYLDAGELVHAVTSMGSDLTKHEGTEHFSIELTTIGLIETTRGPEAVRQWIEGFQ